MKNPSSPTSFHTPTRTQHPLASLVLDTASAGIFSAAENDLHKPLDLNELLVKHPAATFFVRVRGQSMKDAGIQDGDILVVDRSLQASHGKIILAIVNGEFAVKRLYRQEGQLRLQAAHPAYQDVLIDEGTDFQVWGVITYVIHHVR